MPAAVVYATPVASHRSVGLDVTTRVRMEKAEVRRRFKAPLLRPVLDFAEVWFEHAERLTFHDPLAAATIFNSRVCRFARGEAKVNLATPVASMLGETVFRPSPAGPHEVAVTVDRQRFLSEYFGVLM